MPLREIHVQQFVRRFKDRITERGARFAFFLGAGCSISSGIPSAARLVRRWLVELKKEDTGSTDDLEEWVGEKFPNYDPDNPASSYAEVMKTCFPEPRERQNEIERMVEGKDPSFGYGVFTKLITDDSFGPQCNVVLTSNFDDLVADALYLYTRKKPLVIAHESLADFARETNHPLVIKLHGDALFDPKSLEDETADLDPNVTEALARVMQGRGLVILGYGGNDKGILKALKSLSESVLDWGIYWINDVLPDNDFGRWLKDNNANWVKHLKFDELMVLVRSEFDLDHPDEKRFDVLMNTYRETFHQLSGSVDKRPAGADKEILESAVKKAASDFKNWWSVELEARRHRQKDPDLTDKIYRKGLENFPDSAELLGHYAIFLTVTRKDHDAAEEYFHKAIEAAPHNAITLGNYAKFLNDIRKDHDTAEEYYRRAIEADPEDANTLRNYAIFLRDIRRDHDATEEYHRRAIEADPNNGLTLCSYANFLAYFRKDHDTAEDYYKKAIELEPDNAAVLGYYANFLSDIRKAHDTAEEYYHRAIGADPEDAITLGNYAGFLLAKGKSQSGWEYLEKARSLAGIHEQLIIELLFYEYAHETDEKKQQRSLSEMKKMIASGARSPHWDLSGNVERAVADKHPEPELLSVLAKVIADEEKANALNKFEAWKKA